MKLFFFRGAKRGVEKRFIAEPRSSEGVLEQLWSERWFLALMLVLGFMIRWQLIYRMQFSIDSDEAIVGLMAKHIGEGRGIPVFYYGQHYMGSLESLLVAAAFSIFGSSSLVLRAVPLAVSLSLIFLLYLLGREAGGRRAGLIAALLCALPPAALVEWSSKPRGGFIEIVWISALCIWLAIRWTKQGVPRFWQSFFIGAVLGLGWWVNNQIIFTIGTVGVIWGAVIVRHRESVIVRFRLALAHAIRGLLGFVIGGAPFWIYNVTNNFVSFSLFGRAENPLENALGFIRNGVPIIIGAKRFWTTTEIWSGDCIVASLLYGWVIGRIYSGFRRKRIDLFAATMPIIFILLTGIIFSLSSFGWLSMAPRYLLPLYPALFILIALGLSTAGVGESILGSALFVAFHLSSVVVGGWPLPGEPIVYGEDRVARNHAPLIEWLEKENIEWVRTNYWIGYRLAFETDERVRFLVLGKPHETRILEYEKLGHQVDPSRVAYVLTAHQGPVIEQSLRALSISYERAEVGSYVVLYRIQNPFKQLIPLERSMLRASASVNQEMAGNAIDGVLDTRWGSGRPQSPEMIFRISSEDKKPIRGVRLELGRWWSDYPRRLQIECQTPIGENHIVLSVENYDAAVSYHVGRGAIEIPIMDESCYNVTLHQKGSDSFFDWSIAEIELLRAPTEEEKPLRMVDEKAAVDQVR